MMSVEVPREYLSSFFNKSLHVVPHTYMHKSTKNSFEILATRGKWSVFLKQQAHNVDSTLFAVLQHVGHVTNKV